MHREETPVITEPTGDTTIESPVPDMNDEYYRGKAANRVLARLIYGLLGLLTLGIGVDKVRDSIRQVLLARVKKRAVERNEKPIPGFLMRMVEELDIDEVTVLQMQPFSGKRKIDLARRKQQFKRLRTIMKQYEDAGLDRFPVAARDLKETASIVKEEALTLKGPQSVNKEMIDNFSFGKKLTYFSKLYARIFREKYYNFLTNRPVRLALLVTTTLLGIYVFPQLGLPNVIIRGILLVPTLWGGAPWLINPLLLADPSVTFPALFWVPFLAVLPGLVYWAPLLVLATWTIAKLLIFNGIWGIGRYALGKVAFLFKFLKYPLTLAGKGLVNSFLVKTEDGKIGVRTKNKTGSPVFKMFETKGDTIVDKHRQTTYDVSTAFGNRAIDRVRAWAEENDIDLDTMPVDEVQRIVDSFVIEQGVQESKYVLLQDEGNELVVNVEKAIDTIETSPGMYGVLPAIYVPFYVPEKKDFDKFFWGIIIQNVTQSIQYSASMAMRSLRGLEKGANVAHPVFQHVISKSEKNMASFVVHVQGRWLTGHIHVVRPELQGGRIALDVSFEPLEIDKKVRTDGRQYTTVQEYIDDLINRDEEVPEIDKDAVLEGSDADSLDIRISGIDDEIASHIKDTLQRVFPITSGYYRAYPADTNPYYGPGENESLHGTLPQGKEIDANDLAGLGNYKPTQGVLYARAYYFGALTYVPGGVKVRQVDGKLVIEPTGQVAKYDFRHDDSGTKARNLNSFLQVLQGTTYMKREIVRQADGKVDVKLHLQDVSKEYFPEVEESREVNKERAQERGKIFKRGYYDLVNKHFTRIFDKTTGSYIPVNLGAKLGFQPFEGLKGFFARWKAMTLGMLISIAPVSLFGLIQDPINAALQGYYDPIMVEKQAQFRMWQNKRDFMKYQKDMRSFVTSRTDEETIINMQTPNIIEHLFNNPALDLMAGEEIQIQEHEFTFPSQTELQQPGGKLNFADDLYMLARIVGIPVPLHYYRSNAELLNDSFISLREFFISLELERLRNKREAAGGELATWDKGLAEYGAALLNAQERLTRLSTVFPKGSFQNQSMLYLASSIGNMPGHHADITIVNNGTNVTKAFDENSVYQIGMYNRVSGEYSAAYNRIAGMTYHGSHEDDVQRSERYRGSSWWS